MADLAAQLLGLDARISELDAKVAATFRAHPQAEIIESLPGMGPILGAELIAAAGDLSGYADAGRLASAAGLVPVPRDSGRRTGNLHRPVRYSRKLRRVFYLSAQASMMRDGPNRDYYLKKRGEGTSTSRHSSLWSAAASTCSGHYCATTVSSSRPHQRPEPLDNFIENPPMRMAA